MSAFNKIEEKKQTSDLDKVKELLDDPKTTLPDVLTNQICYKALKLKYPPLIE